MITIEAEFLEPLDPNAVPDDDLDRDGHTANSPTANAKRAARLAERADLRARAAAVAGFSCLDNDAAWAEHKATLAAKAAVAKERAIGAKAAEAQLRDAAAKKEAAETALAAAERACVDAGLAVASAESRCSSEGESAWPEYNSALDAAKMREHLRKAREGELEIATGIYEAAIAVFEREQKSDVNALHKREFDAAVKAAAAGLAAAYDQARAALSLYDQHPNDPDFHFRAFAAQVQSAARALRPSPYVPQFGTDLAGIAWSMVTG